MSSIPQSTLGRLLSCEGEVKEKSWIVSYIVEGMWRNADDSEGMLEVIDPAIHLPLLVFLNNVVNASREQRANLLSSFNGKRLMRHLVRSMCELSEMVNGNVDAVPTLNDYAIEWFERLIMKLI